MHSDRVAPWMATLVLCSASALLMPAPVAHGGIIRHDRPQHLYLELGQNYPAVGGMAVRIDVVFDVFDELVASGVLISPDWVLTAAHVVDAITDLAGFADPFFVPGPDLIVSGALGQIHFISEMHTHPSWDRDDEFRLFRGFDIALVKLSQPLTGVTPATLYTGTDDLGQGGVFTGYGYRGTGVTGFLEFADYLLRAGENMLDVTGSSVEVAPGQPPMSDRIILADFDHPDEPSFNIWGDAEPLNLEYLIAPGDSGGGVFVDFGNGPELIGINSFLGTFDESLPTGIYGEIAGATRVAFFNDWIFEVTGIPEPGSAGAILLLALLGLGQRRRRVSM